MVMGKVLVVGGGISGLSLCHALVSKTLNCVSPKFSGFSCTLIEATKRCGGWIETTEYGGSRFERGPRSLMRRKGDATINLIESLKMEDQVVLASKAAYHRYIWMDGGLHILPYGFNRSLLNSPPLRSVPIAIVKECFKPPPPWKYNDETIHHFIQRRFNKHVADFLIDSMVAGIYSGNPKKLSVKSCFPDLYKLEEECGSVVWGMLFGNKAAKQQRKLAIATESALSKRIREAGGIYSFTDGMGALPFNISKAIAPHTDIRTDTRLIGLQFMKNSVVATTVNNSTQEAVTEEYNHVFSTIDSLSLASILETNATEVTIELKETKHLLIKELNNIVYASVWVVNMTFDEDVASKFPGFGFLVPTIENLPILGVSFDSCFFPDSSGSSSKQSRITVMLGGDRHKELINYSDKEIQNIAVTQLMSCLGLSVSPTMITAHLATNCIPQYYVGHAEKVKRIEALSAKLSNGNLSLLGPFMHGVSINDCITNSTNRADVYMDGLQMS